MVQLEGQRCSIILTTSLISSHFFSFTRDFQARTHTKYKILKVSLSERIGEQRNSKVITYSKSTDIAQMLEKASQAPSTFYHRERLLEASGRGHAELSCIAGS